ncbi:hypothetical protein [Fluviicola chungangensis]|uniref:Uncharacterized protein n=1 Tax=Fluviicola chungangensis TaxID=2597671 RepID=A0A556N7K0_9FLAO|nr:hypothetical protein [Fluviicola chungangensis]TSJ48156.1 hypothetical protein FO442_03195 [Fluviicola chungangensis]
MIKKLGTITIAVSCLLVFLTANSCKKNEEFDMYYDYFPLNEGHYVIYSAHEVFVDQQVNLRDTFDYFIKTVVGDTITDNSGRIARQFERYYSAAPNGPWMIHDIWTAIIDNGRAELVEENNRTIKLVFAPSEDDEWDMNAYNTLDPLNCYYSGIHEAYALGNNTFPSTVTVEQEEFNSYIDSRRKFEVYARGIGMVHKYFKDFIINNGNPDNIKKGHLLEMRLVSSGN